MEKHVKVVSFLLKLISLMVATAGIVFALLILGISLRELFLETPRRYRCEMASTEISLGIFLAVFFLFGSFGIAIPLFAVSRSLLKYQNKAAQEVIFLALHYLILLSSGTLIFKHFFDLSIIAWPFFTVGFFAVYSLWVLQSARGKQLFQNNSNQPLEKKGIKQAFVTELYKFATLDYQNERSKLH